MDSDEATPDKAPLRRTQVTGGRSDPKDGTWRTAKWIRRISRADWELFLGACKEVINRFNIKADSPLLAMTITEGIRMNIANREALSMHGSLPTLILIMLPNGERERLLGRSASNYFPFQGPQNAEGVRIDPDLFRSRWNELSEGLFSSVEELISRRRSSPYRKSHNSDLYHMAVDTDFRERALDHLLEGKGEWPGSVDEPNVNYWVFQSNPRWYDAPAALRARAVDRWSVGAHKRSVKPGDNAIIWVTGPSSGCYALATVHSLPQPMEASDDRFTLKGEFNTVHDRVLISIDHNLCDRPILWESIKDRIPNLKAGNQGTTFAASQEEYELLLELATINGPKAMHDLNTILYGPPGTGKTYALLQRIKHPSKDGHLQKAATVLSAEATFWHLAPGGGGHLWEALKKGDRLGYEWASKAYGDLSKVKRDTVGENFNIVTRLAQVRQDDYICVISGKRLLGLARATHGYDHDRAMAGPFDFQTVDVEWVQKFDPPLLLSKSNTPAFTRIGAARWNDVEKALAQEGISIGSNTVPALDAKPSHLLVTFHQSFSYEDFVEGIKPELSDEQEEGSDAGLGYVIRDGVFKNACNEAVRLAGYADLETCLKDNPANRRARLSTAPEFHLVIDEINRGNVAGVFGELITLIEPDKRLGSAQEVFVTLPYSRSPFGVPMNLRITGTMNTADRSVEALDTALRRRFSFVEMPSRPDLITQPDGLAVQLRELLSAINGRIERLLDKDHHIGHSYLMGIHEAGDPEHALRLVFKNKVLPLLQEYFYGDPRKLGAVLGPQWVIKQEASRHKLFGRFDLDDAGKDVFDVTDPMEADLEAFMSIHE